MQKARLAGADDEGVGGLGECRESRGHRALEQSRADGQVRIPGRQPLDGLGEQLGTALHRRIVELLSVVGFDVHDDQGVPGRARPFGRPVQRGGGRPRAVDGHQVSARHLPRLPPASVSTLAGATKGHRSRRS